MSSTPATPQRTTNPEFWANLRQLSRRDLGSLPVLGALIVLAVYFQNDSNGLFLTPRNLSNLILQVANIGTISLASVLVLLIGEIDLSLAAVSSFCGAVMVTQSVYHGWPAWAAIAAAMGAGLVIGFINGMIVAILRVPAFIVTLAALIGYSGLLLHILLPNTSIRITDPFLKEIASNYLPEWLGWTIGLGAVGIYAAVVIFHQISRRNRKLPTMSITELSFRIGVVVLLVVVAVNGLSSYLGVPYSAVILIGLITLFWLILGYTRYGRSVYAVGGNAEASRRAGINVTAIKVSVFMLASMLAGVAGVLESSRTFSASSQVDSTLLLSAIAAAVIGGVSLFGGRGTVWAVVLGVLVIGGLQNGLVLQGRSSDIQQMVEAVVLILAVIVDAVLRRRSQ